MTNNLIEKITAYKKATQALIDKTQEYETFIKTNIPAELFEQFSIGRFGNSNTGYEHHVSVGGKLIPNTVKSFSQSFYWGGDFSCLCKYVAPEDLIEWARNLPALMADAEAYIENLTKEAEKLSI